MVGQGPPIKDNNRRERAAGDDFKIVKPESLDLQTFIPLYQEGLNNQIPPASKERHDEQQIRAYLSDKEIFLCKDIQDETVAFITVQKSTNLNDPTTRRLGFFYSKIQRKGIGSMMVRHVAEHLQQQGVERLTSRVSARDQRVRAFYKKCGFGEKETEDGLIVLEARIDDILQETESIQNKFS